MESRKLPKILSSRSLPGVVAAYSRRNMAWNDDGQCLLVTRQAATVAVSCFARPTANGRHHTSQHRSIRPLYRSTRGCICL